MKTFNNRINKILTYAIVLLVMVGSLGCKRALEVNLPIDNITGKEVFSRTNTASLAVAGIYNELANNDGIFEGTHVGIFGMFGDEMQPVNGSHPLYVNSISTAEPGVGLWVNAYRSIYQCNSAIEGLSASTTIPEKSKEILLGEVKFMRALLYFNMVNWYGAVPLVITTDYKVNGSMARTQTDKVYQQIIKDLLEAQESLANHYLSLDVVTETSERVRPNSAAATALLSKVYLYLNNWIGAETEATKLISNTAKYGLVPLDEVFLKNSKEAIWQLQPSPTRDDRSQQNTLIGSFFIPFQQQGIYNVPWLRVSNFLLDAFEATDERKTHWIREIPTENLAVPIPFKYKVGSNTNNPGVAQEYTMMFRLAEQYLIRAEARARQGKLTGEEGAQGDLDAVRNRAGLAGTTATGGVETMLNAIDQERYVELFTESSMDRWFNMRRRGTIDARMRVVCPIKGGVWEPYKSLMPIPAQEFVLNPSLSGHQNPGYFEN